MIINDVNSLMRWQTAPEWDFEWDYSMGKLEEQTGWAIDTLGTTSSTLQSNGQKVTAAGTNSYYQIYPSREGNLAWLRTMPNGIGVIECEVYIHLVNTNHQNCRINIVESSSNRFCIYQAAGKWRKMDNNAMQSGTAIADFTNNTTTIVRLEMNGSSVNVYLNNSLAGTISTSGTLYGSSNSIMPQNMGTGYIILKTFKLRVGRLV